jgi:hypothetical protein
VRTEPNDVVLALRSVLGPTADVSLDKVGEAPFAVVKLPAEGECWVDLAVSIDAFPSASAEAVAHAIAEAEGWA